MPAAFTRCQKSGGRIRRKSLSGNRFMNICFKGGKSFAGDILKKKRKKKR